MARWLRSDNCMGTSCWEATHSLTLSLSLFPRSPSERRSGVGGLRASRGVGEMNRREVERKKGGKKRKEQVANPLDTYAAHHHHHHRQSSSSPLPVLFISVAFAAEAPSRPTNQLNQSAVLQLVGSSQINT